MGADKLILFIVEQVLGAIVDEGEIAFPVDDENDVRGAFDHEPVQAF